MKNLFLSIVLLPALLVLSGTDAHAFQCGDRLVYAGETMAAVIAKCGDPAAKLSRVETITERTDTAAKRYTSMVIDEWTYNLGPDAFMRYLRFENGTLIEIQAGDYGY